jgi:flagellar hook-associated protein 3 FlgL
MSGISSLSSFLQNITLVQNAQNQIAKLTYQVDTGLKSQDLQGYGNQANQLLNLGSSQVTEQNYISNNTQTSTMLTAYDTTLGQISSDATKLSAALDAFTVTDPNTVANLKALVAGLQTDLAATLNTQVGGRYLYGGTRYTTQPVGDLTAASQQLTAPIPDPTATPPTVFTPAVSPAVPTYDNQAAQINGTPQTAAQQAAGAQTYQTQNTAIATNEQMTYGISSNDAAFQNLVSALQNALGAVGSSGTTQAQFIQNASAQVQAALTGIQGLQNQNGTAETLVATANTVHAQTLATLQSQITTITQVDPATVATQLSTAQNTLEGSYKVVSSVLNLTLLNYLK